MTQAPFPRTRDAPSFWHHDAGPVARRPCLDGDTQADVCIVGAGYTGLWTAHYLLKADPSLRVLIVERETAGFGASGRNGGWLTGGFAWNHDRYLATSSPRDVRAMVQAMNGTVDEVIRVAEAAGIDADIHRTDELMIAVNAGQLGRMQAEVVTRRSWGEDRVTALGARELRDRLFIPGALGAMRVAGVARVQPAKLVRGLARLVESQGAVIAEDTAVTELSPRRVVTDRGIVAARIVLRATEGFTAQLPGRRRDWLPMNSAQIVTEPLPDHVWQQIGWDGREIICDVANAYCYCQRTREGRITVGARGVPYRYGSGIDHNGEVDAATFARLTAILHRHFPAARTCRIETGWCGVLGVPRDWCASVGFDAATGLGHAGGYVGVGVSTSNLAGRTLADLALGRDTDLTRLPWVNRRVRKWEPEPLRWLAVRGMYRLLEAADLREARPGAGASRLARVAMLLAGK